MSETATVSTETFIDGIDLDDDDGMQEIHLVNHHDDIVALCGEDISDASWVPPAETTTESLCKVCDLFDKWLP